MDEPLYLKIYQSLKQDIENSVYKPGDQVPTEGGLADLFHVSKITSKRALNMLAEEGLLSRQKGRRNLCKSQDFHSGSQQFRQSFFFFR